MRKMKMKKNKVAKKSRSGKAMEELYATLMALDLAWDKGFQVGVDRV